MSGLVSGVLKGLNLPTGQYAGETVTPWLTSLHMARVFGLPMQIFVCLMGLVVTMLSVTGVIISRQKRRARRVRDSAPCVMPAPEYRPPQRRRRLRIALLLREESLGLAVERLGREIGPIPSAASIRRQSARQGARTTTSVGEDHRWS